MYRGKDSEGLLQGGHMYVVKEGLPKAFYPLAVFFAVAGIFGATPVFQANQVVQVTQDVLLTPLSIGIDHPMITRLIIGLIIVICSSLVIFGGIKKIGEVASRLVPSR